MTTKYNPDSSVGEPAPDGPRRHGWMMIACCIPMLALAIILVATGGGQPGLLLAAVDCTLMMALMMGRMNKGAGARADDDKR